jgi:hypothetical protein
MSTQLPLGAVERPAWREPHREARRREMLGLVNAIDGMWRELAWTFDWSVRAAAFREIERMSGQLAALNQAEADDGGLGEPIFGFER